jgi:hypothetical protein
MTMTLPGSASSMMSRACCGDITSAVGTSSTVTAGPTIFRSLIRGLIEWCKVAAAAANLVDGVGDRRDRTAAKAGHEVGEVHLHLLNSARLVSRVPSGTSFGNSCHRATLFVALWQEFAECVAIWVQSVARPDLGAVLHTG